MTVSLKLMVTLPFNGTQKRVESIENYNNSMSAVGRQQSVINLYAGHSGIL